MDSLFSASSSQDPFVHRFEENAPPPAVIRAGNRVSLADHLSLANLPLATTPGGANFATKALHPADGTIRTTRLPGGNRPTTAIYCDMVETIPMAAGMTTVVYSLPSPAVPCTVVQGGAEGGMEMGYHAFGNAAFGSRFMSTPTPTFYKVANSLVDTNCECFRVTAQSITVELVAPATANQGTMLSAYVPEKPQKFYAGTVVSPATAPDYVTPPSVLFDHPPQSSKLLLGTNAYTTQAVDGVYAPLKLTKFGFKMTNRPHMCLGMPPGVTDPPVPDFTFNPATNQLFPYPGNNYDSDTPLFHPWSSPGYSKVTISGVADNTSVRIRVRQVCELVPYPGTVFASLVESPLPPDDLALRMYLEVSGKMKDGYPASYNDLDTLRSVVHKIAKGVLPFVDPAVDMLATMVALLPGGAPFAAMGAAPAKLLANSLTRHVIKVTKPESRSNQKTPKRKQ